MQQMLFSWDNVVSGNGVALSVTGMSIVFLALILVSCYIALLPKIAALFNKILPPAAHHSGPVANAPAPDMKTGPSEAEIVAAAVAYLHKNKG
ncbi:OadG family protein [Maridesulfovibrio sp.]|jgi:oxaloacetate decarboxylase gamma subunit|uniref:OadG family protein n=1 Tax=Maridesulfovibrio sp. TaxID=2795000 RepID=UPI0029CA710E|nr:OadG family protein [Maridesulfovibrio sp.]